MRSSLRSLAFVSGSLFVPSVAFAQEVAAEPRAADATHVFVETDPATFAFEGYAAHARIRPSSTPHWSFGAGVYAMKLPTIMVDVDPANRDRGWSSRIAFAFGAFVDRSFRDDGDGLFVGAQLGAQRFRVTRGGVGGEGDFTAVLAMPRVGYVWRPFDAGFYLMPWLGVGMTAKVGGDTTVGDASYHVLPVVAFATLHAGWRF